MIVFLALSLLQQQPAPGLTLGQALDLARTRRAAVTVAGAAAARARGTLRVAGAVPNPIAGYSYTEDLPRQHVSLEQSLDWLLTRGPERAAGRADLSRALADSVQAVADLTAEVRTGFYTAMAAAEVERLTADQARLADSMVTIARARLARGDIPLLEQEQLALEATRTAQRFARAREAAEVAGSRVAQLIGWSDAAPLPPLVGDLAEGSESDALIASDSTVVTPRLLGARADSIAASARVRSAGRAAVPLPTLQVGADWDDPSADHTPLAVVGLAIPLPLWQHGRGASAVARAEAQRSNAALTEVAGVERQRLVESTIRLRFARARALVARDSLLPLARRVRGRAATAYQAGESSITQLLEALRAERDVAAEAIDDLLAWQEARAAWDQVRGLSR